MSTSRGMALLILLKGYCKLMSSQKQRNQHAKRVSVSAKVDLSTFEEGNGGMGRVALARSRRGQLARPVRNSLINGHCL